MAPDASLGIRLRSAIVTLPNPVSVSSLAMARVGSGVGKVTKSTVLMKVKQGLETGLW